MNAVFSPGFFEGIVGGQELCQGGGRNVRDYLFSLCVHSSPQMKQERNSRARKKKQKQKE